MVAAKADDSSGPRDFDLGACLEHLRALLEFGRSEVAKGCRADDDAYDTFLIAALFSRATTTIEAIALLCEQRFGQQAMMLTRAAYELLVDAYWVDIDRKRAGERFLQHARFHQHLKRELVKKYPVLADNVEVPNGGLPADELRDLKKLYAEYGTRSWTGLSIHARLKQIEAELGPEDRHQLWFFHQVFHRLFNEELHPTAWSIKRVVRRVARAEGGEKLQFRVAPEPELSEVALPGCWWIYLQFLHLMIGVFEAPLADRLEELGRQGGEVFAGG